MGGLGSGISRGYSTTEGKLSLSICNLRKAGLLVTGKSWGWQWSRDGAETGCIQGSTEADMIVLSYSQRIEGGEWQDISLPVWLEWTDCNYGGQRAWFLCPHCGQKASVLYSGDSCFACRKCLRLKYACQRESKSDRAFRRAHKLRLKLGRDTSLPAYHIKPKGMYWRTFERLRREELHYDNLGVLTACGL
jgi:hypothetical protein